MSVHYLQLLSPTRVPIRYLLTAEGEYMKWPDATPLGRSLPMALVDRLRADEDLSSLIMVDANGSHWIHPSRRGASPDAGLAIDPALAPIPVADLDILPTPRVAD